MHHPRQAFRFLRGVAALALPAAAVVGLAAGCGKGAVPPDAGTGPRKIIYWEKWTGFEGEAAEQVVKTFNAQEQQKARTTPAYRPIQVQLVSVAEIEQKLMVAIAGGNPPDVAGIETKMLYPYIDKGALLDLTEMIAGAGISKADYIPVFWNMCEHHGRQWALPTTPSTTALHWNKRLFSEAGLNPDVPPATLEELDAWAEKLTRWEVVGGDGTKEIRTGFCTNIPDADKRLVQVGFLPAEPGWWPFLWCYHFGGRLFDENGNVTAAAPENVQAFEWLASYSKKLGVAHLQRFISGFGNFSSPQNPFLSGKVAMEIQGVWMYNFIDKYAPGLQWGVAPFPYPKSRPELARTTLADVDMVVIPKGARHPQEAFAFMRYLNSQEGMEMLCLGHRKFSPLMKVSSGFVSAHPHPYVALFRDLAFSPTVVAMPKSGTWNEYQREMENAAGGVQDLNVTPAAALAGVQARLSGAVERNRRTSQATPTP
ncbi:MAG: ABC transporter substrate-binding protein [Lentisphaeria bacterium]